MKNTVILLYKFVYSLNKINYLPNYQFTLLYFQTQYPEFSLLKNYYIIEIHLMLDERKNIINF